MTKNREYDLVDCVCQYFGIDKKDFFGRRRHDYLFKARVVCAVIYFDGGHSPADVATKLNRDRTTTYNYRSYHESNMKFSKPYRAAYECFMEWMSENGYADKIASISGLHYKNSLNNG